MTAKNKGPLTPEQEERSRKAKAAWEERRKRKAQEGAGSPEHARPLDLTLDMTGTTNTSSASDFTLTTDQVDLRPREHVIHFVADGLTALGKVWYRGEELRITEGSKRWEEILDKNGWAWISMADNYAEQVKRYGEEKFKSGPWPFEKGPMTEADYDRALSENDQEAIARYEKDKQRSFMAGRRTGT